MSCDKSGEEGGERERRELIMRGKIAKQLRQKASRAAAQIEHANYKTIYKNMKRAHKRKSKLEKKEEKENARSNNSNNKDI